MTKLTGFDYVWKRLTTPIIRQRVLPPYTRIVLSGVTLVVDFAGQWVPEEIAGGYING